MPSLRTAAMLGMFMVAMGILPALGQDPNIRMRILDMILSNVVCCSTDMSFSKPAHATNVPPNLGIAITPAAGGEASIRVGRIVRSSEGKAVLNEAYSLDSSCKPVPVQGPPPPPNASFYSVSEIAARNPKDPAEKLWPVVNATFQSTLLGALKLPSPPARYTCLRQHLERVIHGEEGRLR